MKIVTNVQAGYHATENVEISVEDKDFKIIMQVDSKGSVKITGVKNIRVELPTEIPDDILKFEITTSGMFSAPQVQLYGSKLLEGKNTPSLVFIKEHGITTVHARDGIGCWNKSVVLSEKKTD